jgi:CBS domain-containing protein
MVKTADNRRETLQEIAEPVVADFMTRNLVTVTADMDLCDAVELLLKKRVSNTPVVKHTTRGNKLVGLLTERDCLEYLTDEIFYGNPKITVESVMKHIPVCVSPDTDIFTVSSIFIQQGYRHLPVVRNTHLLGVVSRRDVLRGLKDYHKKQQRVQVSERKTPDLRKILMNRRLLIK